MKSPEKYQICNRCIMDTSDPDITFDEQGVCNHCHRYEQLIRSDRYLAKQREGALTALVEEIKKAGRGQKYDCIIGISGGVDSSYTACKVKEIGLRPLAVHLDNGWDSELAVSNIENLLRKLDIDLYTEVLDWDEFKNLQLAFLKASTPDSEIPTDHAIVATLYRLAARHGIRYILTGVNTATEGGGVAAWSQGQNDWRYIKSINKLFGNGKLKSFPHYGPIRFMYYKLIKKIKYIEILDYFDYNKQEAISLMENKFNWKNYEAKHNESFYTRFFQGFILPQKFGFHKKREHLSFLIFSHQINREEALLLMSKDDYPEDLQNADKYYVAKKFGVTMEEFDHIMAAPPKSFWDYPSIKKSLYKYKWLVAFYHKMRRQ